MKLLISFMTAVSLGLTSTVLAGDTYSALAAQGYRWVTINGPYACNTEQGAERIVARIDVRSPGSISTSHST